jgi:hypothetical protein
LFNRRGYNLIEETHKAVEIIVPSWTEGHSSKLKVLFHQQDAVESRHVFGCEHCPFLVKKKE